MGDLVGVNLGHILKGTIDVIDLIGIHHQGGTWADAPCDVDIQILQTGIEVDYTVWAVDVGFNVDWVVNNVSSRAYTGAVPGRRGDGLAELSSMIAALIRILAAVTAP